MLLAFFNAKTIICTILAVICWIISDFDIINNRLLVSLLRISTVIFIVIAAYVHL